MFAYLNGKFVPHTDAVVSVTDGGFVQGTTVAEQLRTFGGQLFKLDEHLARLFRSLAIVGVEPALGHEDLASAAVELSNRNHRLLNPADDLNLTMFVTPGGYGAFGSSGPVVCMHTAPLPFHLWVDKYEVGESLFTTSVEQVSARCWPPELKCRSRMHYFLADRQARRHDPQARAVMLDADGFVTEATTANLLIFRQGHGLIAPPKHKVLPGISLSTLEELATTLSVSVLERDLRTEDLASADEVLLCSTSPCVWPVRRFNGSPLGDGEVEKCLSRSLLNAWSNRVGLDILGQARRFAIRLP